MLLLFAYYTVFNEKKTEVHVSLHISCVQSVQNNLNVGEHSFTPLKYYSLFFVVVILRLRYHCILKQKITFQEWLTTICLNV